MALTLADLVVAGFFLTVFTVLFLTFPYRNMTITVTSK
jgi:hypothetical protein